jgi:hypothetical protein
MIRPFTCVCFLLACGSGLYLYQSKHRVQVLDREIERTMRGADELREQTRVLHAEWTLLNDPQRLQGLAEQFLALKTVTPGQFTSMADLDARMPAVRPPEPPPVETVPTLAVPVPHIEEPPAVAPLPPPPTPKPAVVAAASPPPPARPPEHKPPPRPVVADPPPPPRVVQVAARPAPVERPRPAPAPPPAVAPAGGSALGMARSASVPPPQPMPVSASQWVSNGGGG